MMRNTKFSVTETYSAGLADLYTVSLTAVRDESATGNSHLPMRLKFEHMGNQIGNAENECTGDATLFVVGAWEGGCLADMLRLAAKLVDMAQNK